jgi:cytochrome c553
MGRTGREAVGAAIVAALAFGVATGAAADESRLRAYGQHLASECTSCHRIDGTDNGIPAIIGWDRTEFVATMSFYRSGARTNAAMVSVAQSLDEQQLDALAAYFGALPKPAKKK